MRLAAINNDNDNDNDGSDDDNNGYDDVTAMEAYVTSIFRRVVRATDLMDVWTEGGQRKVL